MVGAISPRPLAICCSERGEVIDVNGCDHHHGRVHPHESAPFLSPSQGASAFPAFLSFEQQSSPSPQQGLFSLSFVHGFSALLVSRRLCLLFAFLGLAFIAGFRRQLWHLCHTAFLLMISFAFTGFL